MKTLHLTYLALLLPATLFAQKPAPPRNPAPLATPFAVETVAVGPKAEPFPGQAITVPASDPFARQTSAGNPADAPADMPEPNLISVLETYSIPSQDLMKLLQESANGVSIYERVRDLVGAKKANLENMMAVTTQAGRQSTVKGVDEVRYPVDFIPTMTGNEIAYPRTVENREAGDSLQIQPILTPDGKLCDLELQISEVRMAPVKAYRLDPSASPVPNTEFDQTQLHSVRSISMGEPRFIGTISPASRSDTVPQKATVAFLRVEPDELRAHGEASKAVSETMQLDFMVFTMERQEAQKILLGAKNSADLYAATTSLVEKRAAELERSVSTTVKSGNACELRESTAVRFATEVDFASDTPRTTPSPEKEEAKAGPVRHGKSQSPAYPHSFEDRNVGVHAVIEPTVQADSTIDMMLMPTISSDRGSLHLPEELGRYPQQQLFETRSIQTNLRVASGQPGFIGTMNLPRNNGVNDRKDSGKVALAFIRATLIKP